MKSTHLRASGQPDQLPAGFVTRTDHSDWRAMNDAGERLQTAPNGGYARGYQDLRDELTAR